LPDLIRYDRAVLYEQGKAAIPEARREVFERPICPLDPNYEDVESGWVFAATTATFFSGMI